jgi:type II secretory pathway component PulC
MLSYYLWRNDGELPSWKQLRYSFLKTTNRLMIQGIIYNTESPYALIRGKVVHEGETISGYTVVKIHKDRVEFEKNGKIFTKQLLK